MKLNLKALIKTIVTLLVVLVVTSFIFYFTTPLFWINTVLIVLTVWSVVRLYRMFCNDEDDNN
jgi:hypothetical protein